MERHMIGLQEETFNKIMREEREYFLKDCKDNRANGYNKRTLKYMVDITLNLKVPTMRHNNKDLKFSVLQKYKRTSRNFDNKMKTLYGSRSFERDICDILKISILPRKIKEQIHKEYMNKYNAFINMEKEGYDLIKLDATFFGRVDSRFNYTVYFVWGFKGKIKHCLYYCVYEGVENKEGWENVVDYMISNINLHDVKLIVSDLFPAMKKLLENKLPFIPRQNCMFHRFDGFLQKVKEGYRFKRKFLKESYDKVLQLNEREEMNEILESFRFLPRVARKRISGKYSKQIFQRMLDRSYDDNFTFLEVEQELPNYTRRDIIQSMDIESIFSDMKFYLRKNFKYNSCDELTVKIFFFLEYKNYIPT